MRSRAAAMILTLLVAVGLAGCSAIKLGYANLPDLAWYWLDGYLDFTDQQRPVVRDALARLHAWHRREELPKIIDVLARLERAAPGEITPAQACAVVQEAQVRLHAVIDRAEPTVLPLATTFSSRQRRHLQRKYRSNDDTFRKEWVDLPPAELLDKRVDQFTERLEMLYGGLETPQKQVLRQALATSIYDGRRLLAERERRQNDLLQTLAKVAEPGVPAADVRTLMRAYFERTFRSPDAAYRTYQDALLEESCRTIAAVHASTTPAQREAAAKRFRAWQRDLRDLVPAG